MSYFLRVLCRDAAPLSAGEIEEFIDEGCYFDTPEFECIAGDSPDA